MSMYRELLYDTNISKVKGVQFCVLSPRDILQRSVVEVTRTETYAGNEPCDNGLFDIRMGTMELGKTCATCEQTNLFCPGHFGHIVLAKPVFYIKFLKVVIEILRCVCFRCSKLLVDINTPEVVSLQSRKCSRQKRWDAMLKLCQKVRTCPCCREKQPDRIKDYENSMVKMEWRDGENATVQDRVFSAEDVLRVFRRISEEDGEVMGFSSRFNRPEWLICTVLPVPPPAVRPSVRNDTGQRSEDDLTHILSEIIKFNNMLRARIEKGATHESVVYNTMMLQYHVSTLVDNSAPTLYSKDNRTGRTLRTLVDRLKSKEGRIRGNLMGKRVDMSARTVITPDPNLSIDELGVPLQIAMNLTFPQVVNASNLEEMRRLVVNGPDVYPGAKHVRKAQQGMRTVRLRGNTMPDIDSLVEVGDVVERHLRNGDQVLFNRQPSLHKMSMMAHRVRVMPNKSFRLNVCVCSSYNADFDGDEMNMHLPQSLQTHEEIRHLAAVPLHVISPRHSKPIITIVQDVTLGVFRMTQPNTRVTRAQFMNLVCSNPALTGMIPSAPTDATNLEEAEQLTGRQMLSTIIPANTNIKMDDYLIRDGVIDASSGALRSDAFDSESKGLVHSIYADKGPAVFTSFINNTQKLVCDWLVLSGFSVGVSDLVLPTEVRRSIQSTMIKMKDDVYAKIQDVHNDRFENLGTRSNAEFFESEIINILNSGRKTAEKAALDSFDVSNNRMLNMIKSGSKGKELNFSQMVSSVSQQIVDDKRIMDGYENRTLPHFTKFDDGPNSRGFVENSFIDGLTPQEFFFHAMGGRIGLIDTAVRSVAWDTPVALMYDVGSYERVRIGEWIDALLSSADPSRVRRYPQDRNLEVLDLEDVGVTVAIPTTDEHGKASWGKLTAVTRHDPSEAVYRVRTSGGREVTVADSESLLVWDAGQGVFAKKQSRDVREGDFLPALARFDAPSAIQALATDEEVEKSKSHNDMVFDSVASIEKIGNEAYPKLYDVTVPSTLNFVLANGLGVRDTSETGYIQRQLVKSMEDCKVHHDYTVRNAAGQIVQFLYGEDGADAAKLEYHYPPYLYMEDDAVFRKAYLLVHSNELRPYVQPDVIRAMVETHPGGEEGFQAAMTAHYEQLHEDRRYIYVRVHRKAENQYVVFPINIQRIVENTSQELHKYGFTQNLGDLDPAYVLEQIAALERDLIIGTSNGPTRVPLQGVLLRCFLSPKRVIVKYRLDRLAFDRVVQQIRSTFYASLVNPGEVVGITAAQSIGEPTTQLSSLKESRILVKSNDIRTNDASSMFNGNIGSFIDGLLQENASAVVDLGGNSVVLDIPDGKDYSIIGVSDVEKTSWRRISQISRHPANGGMVRIHTKSGKTTCATLSHSFLKRTTAGIVPIKGHDLKMGDRVPVARNIPVVDNPLQTIDIGGVEFALTKDLGWFFGVFLADGCVNGNSINISKVIPEYQDKLRGIMKNLFDRDMIQTAKNNNNASLLDGNDMSGYSGMNNRMTHPYLAAFLDEQFNRGSHDKRVPSFVYASNADFISGVVGGYFDGDGNVNLDAGKADVRSASVSESFTEDFVMLLMYLGIFATKKREIHIKYANRNDLHTVHVLRKYSRLFREKVGFTVKSKADALDRLVEYVEREDAHSAKEEIDKIPEIGDNIAFIGKALQLEGQSRTYGKFSKKESIGRETLRKYLGVFEEGMFVAAVTATERFEDNAKKLTALQQLHDTSVTNARNVIPLPSESGKMIAELGSSVKKSSGFSQYAKLNVISRPTLQRHIDTLAAANVAKRDAVLAAVDSVEPHMTVLRQALDADVVWDEIVKLDLLEDPKEFVYDFTVPGNDSFMVDCGVLVHNTLNSVHYDEELLLSVDGKLERVSIGDFTHRVIDAAEPSAKEKHPHDTDLAWVRNPDVKVMACDEAGRVTWETVEAVTRHPVINEDGSDTLLHVRTRSGREVRATRGKSFLKRIGNKIIPINGSELKIGDRVPVSTVLPAREVAPVDHLRVEDHLPPSEWLYMSHVERALAVKAEGKRTWYVGLKDRGVHVPYSRSDIFMSVFVGTEKYPATRKHSTRPGCVYPAHTSIRNIDEMQHIPENIPLDEDFGWLVGAYLSEGCIAVGANKKGATPRPYALLICNMQSEFKARFVRFCETYNIGYHVDAGTRLMKSGNRSPPVSLRMHSLLMGELFLRLFGNGAAEKRVHPLFFGAPDACLHGLLDGYWSGDGCVSRDGVNMSAYSASGSLLIDVQQIMVRFGIMTSLHQSSEACYQYNLTRFGSTTRGWTLSVPACGRTRFRELIQLCVKSKRQRLEDSESDSTHAVYDIVPDIELSTGALRKTRRGRIEAMAMGTDDENDRAVLQRVLDEQIFYDEVVSIEEVPNAGRDRAYDLTVSNSHTFALVNGFMAPNTFHLSGVGSGASGNLTMGVPRLWELFSASKSQNIKTPAMLIPVKKEFATDKAKCMDIMNSIQTVRFRELVKSSRIYYDPSDRADDTLIPDDREILQLYESYADFLGTCDKRKSPWVLRFEFDQAEMLKLNVFFTDIEFALRDHYDEELSCIFSDDNAHKLVARVRLNVSDSMDRNDILTEIMALEQGILDSVVIKGVKDIDKAVLKQPKEVNKIYDDISGQFVNSQEWEIITSGSNLVDVMINPYVDFARVSTNDVCKVLRVLGIEAARTKLYDEIREVMWMSKAENVNYRHMALLVDNITNRGQLVPINRHGIKKGDIGPLAKCSFEETDKMLIKAGIFCELDKINGVSANIMLGQVPPCGTGDGEIIMDIEAITENIDPKDVDPRYTGEADRRDADDREAIEAANAASSSSSAAPSNVRMPERDASLIEKTEDDIVII
jgi:DNA-directed RNA polymerase beta' subunit